ncbi:LysR substrate-binding domain-containing protein [Sphingobium sp. CAP-1]|uniref:LysR substrate-binding domain-containing protein n=1 Tax=Sphingobium sp. CAP-1 TaxID=2676077 RepID=UPI0012BB4197|nr:LysR substrate-binding domain-containing protein [Sphingobium sp. CAP-1]QGP80648.1 LysR family transcriptional regulator [Sphingobium sp. CAP-1]
MDLRHLRYFLCVAEEMHFGRAARRLGMSQPPLSQQIRALEEELGARLFDRTSRRVTLTQAGRMFLPEARQALSQVERAAQVARLAQAGQVGRLGLGFTASAPFVPQVADALYSYRQAHPDVELKLQELGRDDQVARIARDELDIGLIRGIDKPRLPADMISCCLLEEEMLLALREDHPLAQAQADPAIADLAGVPFVLYSNTSSVDFNDHFFALCEQAGFRPDITLEVGSFATLLGLIAAGFGVTILAASLSRLHVDKLILRRLSTQVLSRLWMIHKHDLSPTAYAFRQTILAHNVVRTEF